MRKGIGYLWEADSNENRRFAYESPRMLRASSVLHSHLVPENGSPLAVPLGEDETRPGLGKGWRKEGFLAGQRLSARLRAPMPPPRGRLKAPNCYIGTVLSPSGGACLSGVQVRTGGWILEMLRDRDRRHDVVLRWSGARDSRDRFKIVINGIPG